jgi:hypothetical protein
VQVSGLIAMTNPMVVFRQDHTINHPVDGNKLVIPFSHAASPPLLRDVLYPIKSKKRHVDTTRCRFIP